MVSASSKVARPFNSYLRGDSPRIPVLEDAWLGTSLAVSRLRLCASVAGGWPGLGPN